MTFLCYCRRARGYHACYADAPGEELGWEAKYDVKRTCERGLGRWQRNIKQWIE